MQRNLKLGIFDQCSSLYVRNRNQTNHWGISLFNDFQNEGKKKADISRLIHRNNSYQGWYGIGNNNRDYNVINRKILHTLNTFTI